jgi:hypothetical protein
MARNSVKFPGSRIIDDLLHERRAKNPGGDAARDKGSDYLRRIYDAIELFFRAGDWLRQGFEDCALAMDNDLTLTTI